MLNSLRNLTRPSDDIPDCNATKRAWQVGCDRMTIAPSMLQTTVSRMLRCAGDGFSVPLDLLVEAPSLMRIGVSLLCGIAAGSLS